MINLKTYIHRIIPNKLRAHKNVIMIVSYLLLFLVIAISVWSLNQRIWSDYSANNDRQLNDSKIGINKVLLQNTTKSDSNKSDKLKNIMQIQASLSNEVKAYCEVAPLIKWQTSISQYSDKINDCESKKRLLVQLLGNIDDVAKYLKFDQELATIIMTTNEKTNQNNQPDKWNLIEAFWRQAVVDTDKLVVSDQFKDMKTLSVDSFTKVADAWNQLSSANEAKNRQEFEAACTVLNQNYVALVKISDNGTAKASKLIVDINSSYEKAYLKLTVSI